MVAVLTVLVMACLGLSLAIDLPHRNVRLAEVTAVVEGNRPGTIVAHTERRTQPTRWLVDDSGEAVDSASTADEAAGRPRTQDCVGTVCYRVAATTLRVESSDDGGKTYSVAWTVDGDTYKMLAESYPRVGDPAEHLSSRSIVVHAVAGGHVVFVANGRDGLLYRDVHGAWHRLGSPAMAEGCCYYERPLAIASDPQPPAFTVYAVGIVALAILLSGGITAMIRRRLRWTSALAVTVLAALGAYGTQLAGRFPDVGMFPGVFYGGMLIAVTLLGGVLLAAWFVSSPPSPISPSTTPPP